MFPLLGGTLNILKIMLWFIALCHVTHKDERRRSDISQNLLFPKLLPTAPSLSASMHFDKEGSRIRLWGKAVQSAWN